VQAASRTRTFTPTNYTVVQDCASSSRPSPPPPPPRDAVGLTPCPLPLFLALSLHMHLPHRQLPQPEVFVQSLPGFNSSGFDPLSSSFGLIYRSPSRWRTFQRAIEQLNDDADAHTEYKVFYLARHGEGVHNVGERVHGSSEWNRYWSMLNGDGNMKVRPTLSPLLSFFVPVLMQIFVRSGDPTRS